MLLDIMFFFLLFQLNICNEKKICITKDSETSTKQCSVTIDQITSGSDITSDIQKNIENTDTEVTLFLIGSRLEFNFRLNIFNNKKLIVQFDLDTTGNFDVSDINNIDMNFEFLNNINALPTLNLGGSTLNDGQSSITIKNIKLVTTINDIQLKSFTTESSTFSLPSLKTNSFKIISASSLEITVNDNNAILESQQITFSGENPSLIIDFTTNSYPLTINNQGTSSSSTLSISISNAKSVTFKGNDFSQSNSITIAETETVYSNIGFLPIQTGSFSSGLNLYVNKELTIKGSITLPSSRNFNIGINGDQPTSKILVKIDLISLETGKIQSLSSWIDLTINDLKFNSNVPPFVPCVGYGGVSALVANKITLNDQQTLTFNSISINLDINKEVTDADLPNLIDKENNILTFKSFTQIVPVDDFETITFTPNNINGFGDTKSSRIISIKSSVSTDYIVTLTASSLDSITYVACLKRKSNLAQCEGGELIADISDIPEDKKFIKIKVEKKYTFDFSTLKTTDAVITLTYGTSTYALPGFNMGDVFPNEKVSHLIFEGISFAFNDNDPFVFNSKQVTFKNCDISSQPVITFNENTVVNIDQSSFDVLNSFVSDPFPLTNIITPIKSSTQFEITENAYIFTEESRTISYSKTKLPKVSFQIELSSNDNYNLLYKTTATEIDTVDLLFVSSQQNNPQITVSFDNLDTVTQANKIGLDFGSFKSGNIVDYKTNAEKDFVVIKGENVKILPEKYKPNGKICVCKTQPSSYCEEGFAQITYTDLEKSIKEYDGDTFKIIVVGEQDGNSPTLPIGLLNNKDATIVGVGTNPKILIDCSSEYNDNSKTIEFSNIAVSYSTGNNLHVSNLKLLEETTIDSSFNSIPLTVENLECDVSQLGFKSISVTKSLILTGDATNSNSNCKINFAASSTFTFTLPKSIKISNSNLVFNNLEFDLTNVSPIFSLSSNEFTIDATDGNLDSIGSDIVLQSNQLNSLHLIGNWQNSNPTKFIIFKEFSSSISIDSQNVPVNFEYKSSNNILIDNELSSIAGKISLPNNDFHDFIISTSISGKVSTLQVKEVDVIYKDNSGTIDFKFDKSNINMNIENLLLESKFRIIKFDLLIDLDFQNQVTIVNVYDEAKNQALQYDVECTITENINDPRMKNFISNDHVLLKVNNENTIKSLNKEVTFKENAPFGFNSDNFKLKIDTNQLVFYTVNSPLEGQIILYYGSCPDSSCDGTQIKNEDLSSIEKYIPKDTKLALITFYESIPESFVLDFDKQDYSIDHITLKSNNDEIRNVPVKFGQCISTLEVESIQMKNDLNDEISIQKVVLSKSSSFSQEAKINGISSLQLDKESMFSSTFTEFSNDLLIFIESKDVTLSYTKIGMKITDTQSNQLFNIDVTKMPKVTLKIQSKESPRINLEKDVTELKQIYSLIFDSSMIHIGSNWNLMKSENPIVKYTIEPQTTAICVLTDSFPFEAWDLMTKYTIQFSDVLTPFTFSEKYIISNKKLIINTYSQSTSNNYDVTFNNLVMNGESSIKSIDSEQSNKKLIIHEISIEKGSSSQLINAIIKEKINLNKDSSLKGDFNIDEGLSEINFNWDLNEFPLLNPSTLQKTIPKTININFKGTSIKGKEEEFKEFLNKGIIIMKNFDSCEKIIENIHYKSETVDEFNEDSSKLSLKCKCINENEIQLIYYNEIKPTSTDSDNNGPEIIPTSPPQTIIDDLTVDYDSYSLNGDSVEFTKDGYNDSTNKYVTENNENDVILLNVPSSTLSASTTNDEPKSDIYISPKNKNTNIEISQTVFEYGEIGIHANSNNPSVTLSNSIVPLKIFNDEKSEVTLKVNANSLGLKKIIIADGELNLNAPNSVSEISFEKVEVYKNGHITSGAEVNINKLEMNEDSTITLSKSKFEKKIKSSQRSKLFVNEKVTFNENTEIELTESSYIEFGNSIVKGICKEIKLQKIKSNSKFVDDQEIEIPLICGNNFECSSWIDKFEGDDVFNSAKCIRYKNNNEMCLVATNKNGKNDKDDDDKKKPLSAGAIAGISIAAVVVVVAIMAVFIVLCKKKNPNYSNFDKSENLENLDYNLNE